MTTAVLALQGAFIEHERMLARLGESVIELRDTNDLTRDFDRLILPGGESTTQQRLLKSRDMLVPLRERIDAGMPVFGTCAGMILLARDVEGGTPTFGSFPARVKRNAYGRQLGSFHTYAPIQLEGVRNSASDTDLTGVNVSPTGIEQSAIQIPMTFIRAPYLESVDEDVRVLARVDDNIVAAQWGAQLVCSFHPELDDDTRMHEYFLSL